MKVESGKHIDEDQATSSKLVSVEEDANMLFRVYGAQLHSMLELRKNKDDAKSKNEVSAMQIIRMQGKNLPHACHPCRGSWRESFPWVCFHSFNG